MPSRVTQVLQNLLVCVCQGLTDADRPTHADCGCCLVVDQDIPPATGCDLTDPDGGQGKAWVRFAGASFDTQGREQAGPGCLMGVWNVALEVGVWRCAPEETCVEETATADGVHLDLGILVQAVACCPTLQDYVYTIGNAQVIGPQGGCVGAVVSLVVVMPTLNI